MTISFTPNSAGYLVRQELVGKKKSIGNFIPGPEQSTWIFQPKPGITLAETAMETVDEKFIAYLERQNHTTPKESPGEVTATTPTRPDPDPEQGTAGIEFMNWAAQHMPDEEFATLYEPRWLKKSFRDYAEPCAAFTKRCTNSFPPDCI
jgi:hypothetical protein